MLIYRNISSQQILALLVQLRANLVTIQCWYCADGSGVCCATPSTLWAWNLAYIVDSNYSSPCSTLGCRTFYYQPCGLWLINHSLSSTRQATRLENKSENLPQTNIKMTRSLPNFRLQVRSLRGEI